MVQGTVLSTDDKNKYKDALRNALQNTVFHAQ